MLRRLRQSLDLPIAVPAASSPSSFASWRTIVLLFFLFQVTACASTPREGDSVQQNQGDQAEQAAHPEDPFEDLNRRIFVFNYRLDQWVLRPVAQGYQNLAPQPVQTGVSNFFGNLKDINNSANSALQWKWRAAGNDGGRFVINSTVGLVGIFDVASKVGLNKNDGEDFGQTLAVWGVGQGPYLMLPILGPSTLRDSAGTFVDQYAYPVSYMDPREVEYGLRALDAIDDRRQLLQTESLLTGDSYTLVRDFYLQRRDYLIADGDVEDDFGGDFGEDSYGDDYYYDDSSYSDEDESAGNGNEGVLDGDVDVPATEGEVAEDPFAE